MGDFIVFDSNSIKWVDLSLEVMLKTRDLMQPAHSAVVVRNVVT